LILSLLYDFKIIYVIIWCFVILLYNYFYYLIEISKRIDIIGVLGVIEN